MMKDLKQFCENIQLPDEVLDQVLLFDRNFHYEKADFFMKQLCTPHKWEDGLAGLKKVLGQDPLGFGMLSCMLRCALQSHQRYQEAGISETVFLDTMKVFSRFTREHLTSFGVYGFDREWWTVRQISLTLFRIGELEYERCIQDGTECIHLHIPSDARLLPELLQTSYLQARTFLKNFFPTYASAPVYCHSWLLSPALKEVLPENSHIRNFQKAFTLQKTDPENDSFLEWVYKRKDLSLEQLPENTSLQKNLKIYLKLGGKVGEGHGILNPSAFRDLLA